MIKKIIGMICLATVALGATPANNGDNSKVPPHELTGVEGEEFFSDKQIDEMANSVFVAEKKRSPAAKSRVATEDMLSPQYIEFRDKITKCNSGEEFYSIIKSYDEKYNSIPASATDLKFAVARMATWLPLRGITWKMTPMVHQIVVTQQILMGTLRNLAEQAMINFPDSHVEAQLMFLTLPAINNNNGQKTFEKRFYVEGDFISFLGKDVYLSLSKAISRIEKLGKMANVDLKGKDVETPVVFDARIRFGEDAFGGTYDSMDRFKVLGEAERFATLARLSRRLAAISSMVAYNWNGHLATRSEIGKEFGVGVAESMIFDLAGGAGSEYINGASREKRVSILKKRPQLYKIIENGGKRWMQHSYYHLHRSVQFLEHTWNNVDKGRMDYVMQLDPEVFTARREQVQMGIDNLKRLAGQCGNISKEKPQICDPSVSGADKIVGSLSGKELPINLKAFYDNPPKDLKSLLPVKFARNEEIEPLRKLDAYKEMSSSKRKPDVFQIRIGKGDEGVTTFRNYLYGRATGWNSGQEGYGNVFPGINSTGVADAMAVINETRGARMLNNAFSMFIR